MTRMAKIIMGLPSYDRGGQNFYKETGHYLTKKRELLKVQFERYHARISWYIFLLL